MYIGSEGNGGIHVERKGTMDCRSINTIYSYMYMYACVSQIILCAKALI